MCYEEIMPPNTGVDEWFEIDLSDPFLQVQ